MKKIIFTGILATFLLVACGEEEPSTPVAEVEVAEETNKPTQEELDARLKADAVAITFVEANTDGVAENTKVNITGEITSIESDGINGKFIVTTVETDGHGMYEVSNLTLTEITKDATVTVYGTYDGKSELGFPSIIATIIE